MSIDFHVVIPARYQSSRLPGKLMMDIGGITVIERVYRQALMANPQSITIATDHHGIADLATGFGAMVRITSAEHQSGTDRIAEVVKQGSFGPDDIVVNVQGDEPFIAPELIVQVACCLNACNDAAVATLCWPIEDSEQFNNPNVVKVVRDQHHNALYFSRSAIPANRLITESQIKGYRHIGLYAYRAAFLLDFVTWPVAELERIEALEQLRVLAAGYKIRVEQACVPPLQDINTADDLVLARQLAAAQKIPAFQVL